LALDLLTQGGVLLRAGGRYAQPWRLELAEPEPLAAAHAPAADQMIRTLPPDENVAKFAAYSAARDLR
jgi:hypothetical protein